MRHQVAGKKLGRNLKSRKALLNNLANSLFLHGQITTTFAKAKFVQSHAEKMITIAKKNRLAARRKIASAVTGPSFEKLIAEIVPGFSKRDSGYTRIIKLSPRAGDNAPMAKISLLAIEKFKVLNSKTKAEPKLARKTSQPATSKNSMGIKKRSSSKKKTKVKTKTSK